ncbi:MAG: dTDP-4-dehydrorhamnose 3,5-epimerase [Cyanobacteriota bacterium]|nr:dTDP-4-dehydrorhamnose 3,5-epimerase [Cyanobacteriota bacterium]
MEITSFADCIATEVPGVWGQLGGPLLLTPPAFGDARGFFFESWNEAVFQQALLACGAEPKAVHELRFVQDNHSRSSRGVLRGLHYQLPPHPQGKLVRCVLGTIYDVAVDIRVGSPSFGRWVAATLSADNRQQLWVPPGFAHGFLTLSEQAEVLYKTTDLWSRPCERAIRWDDPQLAIAWPCLEQGMSAPLISGKDGEAPLLAAVPQGDLFG